MQQEVRDLILHLLADEKAPSWLFIKVCRSISLSRDDKCSPVLQQNKRSIRRLVVVFIPGITPASLGIPTPPLGHNMPCPLVPDPVQPPETSLPVFHSLFSHYCPTRAPGDKYRLHSCLQNLTTAPLPPAEKTKRQRDRVNRTPETFLFLKVHIG
jgi:RNA exonuclease 1